MKNEPVAWMIEEDINWLDNDSDNPCEFVMLKRKPKEAGWIPLYTHPAKTLTDKEIYEVLNSQNWELMFDFARAILRKAQEK